MVGPIVLASAGLGMLAGVAMANKSMEGLPGAGAGAQWDARPRCATCGGTGTVACLCNRWSDGDTGCRTCAGSGRMACRSCGGSGTGRPLPMRLAVRAQKTPPLDYKSK